MADTNNNKILNVPPLRFPEFTDEWEQQRLNEYLEENKTRNTKGLFYKKDVLSVSGDYGIVNQIDLLGRSFAGVSVANYHVVRKGDIVYTKSPLKEYPYGIVKSNKGADGIVSTLYAVYETKSNTISNFVEYYFALASRTNKYFKPIVRIGAKHDMKIGNDEVLDNFVSFPKLDEQRKISDFLSLIEKRIVLQTKIIEKYKSLIKGIVVSITTETPNTRIDKCLVCHSSTLQENHIEDFGDFPVYGANGICGFTVNADFNEPAILIVKDGSGVGNVRFVNDKYSVIGTQNILTPQNRFCLKYIFYCLQAFNFMPYKTGMAIPHIYFKDYGKTKIYCPNFEQQVKIASQIDLIESKIEIETQLLNKYGEQKKFLLSNMFI